MAQLITQFHLNRIVTAADGSDPTNEKGNEVISAEGWDEVLFSINLTGTAPSVTLMPLWWNEQDAAWNQDTAQQQNYVAAGRYLLAIKVRGDKLFLKVTAIAGTSPQAAIEYALQKGRSI